MCGARYEAESPAKGQETTDNLKQISSLTTNFNLLCHFCRPVDQNVSPTCLPLRRFVAQMTSDLFLYADDVIMFAPSAQALQSVVDICELELKRLLDMAINASKCLHAVWPQVQWHCANVTVSGLKINWVSSHRYLGIYLESSFNFKSSYCANKANFYKAFWS